MYNSLLWKLILCTGHYNIIEYINVMQIKAFKRYEKQQVRGRVTETACQCMFQLH